jgi:Tfp pilus assembly protein PilN
MMLAVQKKLLFFLGLGLVMLGLLAGLVIFPLVNKIRAASQKYLFNQETLAKLDQRESLAKELQKDYQARQTDLSKLEGVFLSAEEVVGFITTLETIAEQTGNIFEIKTVSSSVPSDQEEGAYISFRISLWGDFVSLLRFLANLENTPYPPYRLIEIDSLTIQRLTEKKLTDSGASLEEGDLKTVLGIKIYIQ